MAFECPLDDLRTDVLVHHDEFRSSQTFNPASSLPRRLMCKRRDVNLQVPKSDDLRVPAARDGGADLKLVKMVSNIQELSSIAMNVPFPTITNGVHRVPFPNDVSF
jgi:hypothetical protein